MVPTTFTDEGALDLESQRRSVDFLIDAGSDGLCILANYSEQFALADDERETLTETILKHVKGLSLPGAQATLRKQLLDAEKGWRGDLSLKEMTVAPAEAALPAADELTAWPAMESAYAPMAPAEAQAREESPLEWLISS